MALAVSFSDGAIQIMGNQRGRAGSDRDMARATDRLGNRVWWRRGFMAFLPHIFASKGSLVHAQNVMRCGHRAKLAARRPESRLAG